MQGTVDFPRLSAKEYIRSDREIRVNNRTVKDRFLLHCHDFFEVEIILKGNGIHVLNGKNYPISSGSAYLVKPTDIHEIIADGEITLCNIVFKESTLNEAMLLSLLHLDTQNLLGLDEKPFESMVMAARLLENECETNGGYQRQMLEYLLHFFADGTAYSQRTEQLSGIKRALLYLEVHFREHIDLSTLAKEAGFHPMYFSAIFKKTTGESYVQKLNHLRLEYAATLLSNNYSVSYACFESGFGSLSNFFTAFKKKYGVSPKEYAKEKAKKAKQK